MAVWAEASKGDPCGRGLDCLWIALHQEQVLARLFSDPFLAWGSPVPAALYGLGLVAKAERLDQHAPGTDGPGKELPLGLGCPQPYSSCVGVGTCIYPCLVPLVDLDLGHLVLTPEGRGPRDVTRPLYSVPLLPSSFLGLCPLLISFSLLSWPWIRGTYPGGGVASPLLFLILGNPT